jgi:hypothetical protein
MCIYLLAEPVVVLLQTENRNTRRLLLAKLTYRMGLRGSERRLAKCLFTSADAEHSFRKKLHGHDFSSYIMQIRAVPSIDIMCKRMGERRRTSSKQPATHVYRLSCTSRWWHSYSYLDKINKHYEKLGLHSNNALKPLLQPTHDRRLRRTWPNDLRNTEA